MGVYTMCCRYWIGPDMMEEIRRLLMRIDNTANKYTSTTDIRPSEKAPIIYDNNGTIKMSETRWGYPSFGNGGLVINARAESVWNRKLFHNGIHYHRAVIPASGFYEWNRNKEKNLFFRKDSSVIYMAGFMDYFNQESRFVILTTQANETMFCVHDRMPLILEHDQIEDWICDETAVNQLLKQQSVRLERQTEYEQMTLF